MSPSMRVKREQWKKRSQGRAVTELETALVAPNGPGARLRGS